MRTVKEISNITGISVRTLHYYDEIDLLRPTDKSEAGYRLYDDKALERLQQILFFREFDIPLQEIKTIMDSPALDRNKILQMQRKMLEAKKARMERLIASIDDILKGDNQMDFAVFNQSEITEMFETMIEHMPDKFKKLAIDEFGGLEQWKEHYIQALSREYMHKNYQKVVEWYGGKDEYMKIVKTPISQEAASSYSKRMDAVLQKLADKKGSVVDSFEVKEIVAEFGFVLKQVTQVKYESDLMRAQAVYYRNERIVKSTDEKYGEGTAKFFAQAIEAFYGA